MLRIKRQTFHFSAVLTSLAFSAGLCLSACGVQEDSSAAVTPGQPLGQITAQGLTTAVQPEAKPTPETHEAKLPGPPPETENADGCHKPGQHCRCSNTGWYGSCEYGPLKHGLYCQC